MRFGRENRDDSYRNTDLLKAIFCAFFDATVGVAHFETVDIDGGAAAMERASAARARRRLRRAFAAMRLDAVENEDEYAVYLANDGLDALECDGTAVIVTSAAVPACAAFLGDLELLRLALELGYEWNWATCCSAALNGHLECLKYARERGCDWSEHTCSRAAENGHLECLKYAHERGCPWDEETCACAAYTGHLGCLKYAQDHSAPESARYVVGWQRICACTTDLIVQIALSRQRDGYVSLRELTPAVNHFLRAWPELALPEDVIRRILFDADLKPMTPRARFSRMIALYATK